jgi:hypothetical protein
MALFYTLLSDGTSDRVTTTIQPQWADLSRYLPARSRGLANRILLSLTLYPCDLLFVHRDAERDPRTKRVQEITSAMQQVRARMTTSPLVCVIPVRMTEAWLLFDEGAIRRAAGNPNGSVQLTLPPLNRADRLPDPKHILHDLVKQASGLSRRRLDTFPVRWSASNVSQYIADFSALRSLPAFRALEQEVRQAVRQNRW